MNEPRQQRRAQFVKYRLCHPPVSQSTARVLALDRWLGRWSTIAMSLLSSQPLLFHTADINTTPPTLKMLQHLLTQMHISGLEPQQWKHTMYQRAALAVWRAFHVTTSFVSWPAPLMTCRGSVWFSLSFSLSSCSVRVFRYEVLMTGQSSCNTLSTSSSLAETLAEVLGRVIWKAHHKAVRVFRVEKARSLMAAAKARTSARQTTYRHRQFQQRMVFFLQIIES